jgi:CDP-diacylglycerol---glycerol-3-phosphate 3-phosphatidyltransferase
MNTETTRGAEEQGEVDRIAWIKETLKRRVRAVLAPLVRWMARSGTRPNHLTVLGCLLGIAAGLAFFEGGFRLGALLLALSGVCDILDGPLARELGIESKFGAFLDSALDRLSEGAALVGIAGFYMVHLLAMVHDPTMVFAELERNLVPSTWARASLVAMLALVGSFLVSYTRARAEGLGLQCRVGWFERPERLLLLIVAGAFGVGGVMSGALLVLTVLSYATAAQRVAHVWKATRSDSSDGPGTHR